MGVVCTRWWRLAGVSVVATGLMGVGSLFASMADPYGFVVNVVMVLAWASGTYLLFVAVVAVLSGVFRSRRWRLLWRFTPSRLSRWLAGAMLLSGVSPAAAAGAAPMPSAGMPFAPAVVGFSDDVQSFLDRLGLLNPPVEHAPLQRSTHTVVAGDSFWRIAQLQVAAAAQLAGSAVSVRAVATYWLTLIDANLEILIDASNPDFLQVGQVLTLPPLDAGGLS